MPERDPTAGPAPPELDPAAVCTGCGAHGAIAFDGIRLCPRCYSEKGTCCADSSED